MNKILTIIETIIAVILIILLSARIKRNRFRFIIIHPLGFILFLIAAGLTALSAKLSKQNVKEEIEYMKNENFVRW